MNLVYESNFRPDETHYVVWLRRESNGGSIPIGFRSRQEAEAYIQDLKDNPDKNYTVIGKPDEV